MASDRKIVPFYGGKAPETFAIERRCMDRDGVVIDHLDRRLPAGRVLDIGAGNGYTAARLTTAARRIVPLEPSLAMIDRSAALPWVCAVGQDLPFRPASFSAAYATWAYFFPDFFDQNLVGLSQVGQVVDGDGPLFVVDNAGQDQFCRLFVRDISSNRAWWRDQGFSCQILTTCYRFDYMEEAETLLSFYWRHNGRAAGAVPQLELEYKVAVYRKDRIGAA